jgi:hypothetical protein
MPRILPLLGFNVPWIFGSKYVNIEEMTTLPA